jgi:hypothetical protein
MRSILSQHPRFAGGTTLLLIALGNLNLTAATLIPSIFGPAYTFPNTGTLPYTHPATQTTFTDPGGTILGGVLAPPPILNISFQNPVTAFGFTITFLGIGEVSSVSFSNGDSFNTDTVIIVGQFFGLSSNAPFTSVDVHIPASAGQLYFDKFQFVQASQGIPEPSTFILVLVPVLAALPLRGRWFRLRRQTT